MDTNMADKHDLLLRQYRIAGQEALRLELQPGERLVVQSVDGEQGCEVIVLNDAGNSAPELLVGSVPRASVSIKAQIDEGSNAGQRLKTLLEHWQVPDSALQEVVCFTASDLPAMTVEQSMVLILVAAGENMGVDQHDLASELCVEHFCVKKHGQMYRKLWLILLKIFVFLIARPQRMK